VGFLLNDNEHLLTADNIIPNIVEAVITQKPFSITNWWA